MIKTVGTRLQIAVVGDYNPAFPPHVATDDGLAHAADALALDCETHWVSTPELIDDAASVLAEYSGLYIAPGSPYVSMQGGLNAVTLGRTAKVPLIATCGGYQHVVIQYARRVLGQLDADHAEYDPYASKLFISALTCSMVEQRLDVHLSAGSRAAGFYGCSTSSEQYYCNFGLNPAYRDMLEAGGLSVSGTDDSGEARVLELYDHPFFVATLFVPPLSSRPQAPHPLLVAFLNAARVECSNRAT